MCICTGFALGWKDEKEFLTVGCGEVSTTDCREEDETEEEFIVNVRATFKEGGRKGSLLPQ
jgi:hypothetical protein